jgi:predicted transcriptional regulator
VRGLKRINDTGDSNPELSTNKRNPIDSVKKAVFQKNREISKAEQPRELLESLEEKEVDSRQ